MSKKISIFGYLILFTLIIFFISGFLKKQLIYIEAGPKGGFFDTSAHVLKKRLKDYNINAEVIRNLILKELFFQVLFTFILIMDLFIELLNNRVNYL